MDEVFVVNVRRYEPVGINPFNQAYPSQEDAIASASNYLGSFAGFQEAIVFRVEKDGDKILGVEPVHSILREDLAHVALMAQQYDLQFRIVGSAPTYEVTALAEEKLIEQIEAAKLPHSFFVSNNKGHPDFGKRCLEFTVFGEVDRKPPCAFVDCDGSRIDLDVPRNRMQP